MSELLKAIGGIDDDDDDEKVEKKKKEVSKPKIPDKVTKKTSSTKTSTTKRKSTKRSPTTSKKIKDVQEKIKKIEKKISDLGSKESIEKLEKGFYDLRDVINTIQTSITDLRDTTIKKEEFEKVVGYDDRISNVEAFIDKIDDKIEEIVKSQKENVIPPEIMRYLKNMADSYYSKWRKQSKVRISNFGRFLEWFSSMDSEWVSNFRDFMEAKEGGYGKNFETFLKE
jgi:predicted  nucleic acid-binding Zn-ribbon protein